MSTGLTTVIARLTPDYEDAPPEAPRTLIAKLPPQDEVTRALGTSLRLYERETRFFQELAPRAGIGSPKLYYGATSDDGSSYILLLEDMGRVGTREGPRELTHDEARAGVIALARMHARWWESPELNRYAWLTAATGRAVNLAIQKKYNQAWPGVAERFEGRLDPDIKQIGTRFGPALGKFLEKYTRPPLTLIHGTPYPENMFFRRRDGDVEVVLISWQVVARRPGVWDIAWFITYGLPTERRREQEESLLRLYHSQLKEGGVSEYSWDRLVEDYRAGILRVLMAFVIAEDNLDFSFPGAGDIPNRWLERTAALTDWNCAELIPA
ncbi:MAG: phosphotransferase [Chloroflexi bacterium]|nr:phosphotransferase [Chloroflexota bacterium]